MNTLIPRQPVEYKEGTIKAKDARICYDVDLKEIIVTDINKGESIQSRRLFCSTGASYFMWRENCKNEKNAMIILLKQYFTFTYIWRFDAEIVERAFSEIVEWNDSWIKPELKSGEEGWE